MPATEPPVTYRVTLADLMRIADAACEIDQCRRFYVDQPDRQRDLAKIVADLYDISERAAGRGALDAAIEART